MARGADELPETDQWLTARESRRAAEMRFTKARSEYLLRRWVGKHAVAAAVGLPADTGSLASIELANRPNGAPYAIVEGQPRELSVSLSDRAGWGLCAVHVSAAVGCDLEILEPRSTGFVADFFTRAEAALVHACSGEARHLAANLIWSAKESALKVLTTGLGQDTRGVEVRVPPHPDLVTASGWSQLEVQTDGGRRLPGWWRSDGSFVLTLAADREIPVPLSLPGSVDLTSARPRDSWLGHPLSDPGPQRSG